MEVLDTYFSHVCELDLVWHFHKVRQHAHACVNLCFVTALTLAVLHTRCT